jgi:hypothetical protein
MEGIMKHNFVPYLNPLFIESGSYEGDGIQAALNAGFEQVWSIELSEYYHERCKQRFAGNEKVKLFLGSSVDVLPELLKVINCSVTFWLDGHYSGGLTAIDEKCRLPLLKEIEIIGNHHIKNHTILIDDMRAVGTGGKDTDWGCFTKQDVENAINAISDYVIFYEFGIVENDILVATPKEIDGSWIDKLQGIHKRIYSQSYQDGILEYIFANIGITNKLCVEFGFNSETLTGGSGSNVANLVLNHDWKCVLLDGGFENKEINLHKEFLTPENIVSVFKKYLVPTEPDYVSIDVDSIDLWLMHAMLKGGFNPRVISIEYNSNFPIEMSVTVKKSNKWNGDMIYGASLSALNKVADKFGYFLVAVCNQLDLFFVRWDLLEDQFPEIEQFRRFTGLPLHPETTMERCKQLVQYPSGEELTNEYVTNNPQIFRIK